MRSVCMATFNGGRYLREQLDSILNQLTLEDELIISDDGSTDETCQIIKEYTQLDNRIKFVEGPRKGVIANFNHAIQQSKGDIIFLADQDDVWLPEKIEKSMKTLKEKNVDLVFGDLEVVDEKMNTIYPSFDDFMLLNRKINKYIDSYKVNYLYNCVTGCTILSKKDFIKDILPIPNDSKYVPHDYWMALMIALKGKLAYMPEKYIKYRQHGNNQIGTDKISHKFKKLDQVRELFINVKLGVFGTYVANNEKFPKELQDLNLKALEYFKMLPKKKNFNFRNWHIFHELYKNETFNYYILNFIIMNLPFIGRGLFNIRYAILKLLKKR